MTNRDGSLRLQDVDVFAVFSRQMDDAAIKGSENQPIQHGVTGQISICDLFVAVQTLEEGELDCWLRCIDLDGIVNPNGTDVLERIIRNCGSP